MEPTPKIMAVLGGLGRLVHVEDTAELACHLCEGRHLDLLLVYPIIVPMAMSLDASLPDQECAAQQAIQRGLEVSKRFGCHTETRIVRHRRPADAVLDLIHKECVESIVLGVRINPHLPHDYDRAESAEMEIVHRAECEVIVDREPLDRSNLPVEAA